MYVGNSCILFNKYEFVGLGRRQTQLFLSLSLQNPQPSGQVFHRNRNPSMTLFSLSILFIFKRLQKSRENRTCTDVLFIEYPHDLISDWLNSSKTYMSDRPNRNKFYSVCQHICRMFSQFTRYALSSVLKHICQNISCK